MAGLKPDRGRLTNPYQRPRPNQKPSGLACGEPYQTLPRASTSCARGANAIGGFGLEAVPLPIVTKSSIWLDRRSIVVLPIITGRGVKYTHNDNRGHIIPSNSVRPGLRRIPEAQHTKEVAVGDGGAKHRSMDPPTTWPSVADPPAASTIDQGGPPGLDPTTTSNGCNCPDTVCEASYFGKEFLRMAGIVQMLHRHRPPYDKYPYAHPKRVRPVQRTRTQARREVSEGTVLASHRHEPCGRPFLNNPFHRSRISHIWCLLTNHIKLRTIRVRSVKV